MTAQQGVLYRQVDGLYTSCFWVYWYCLVEVFRIIFFSLMMRKSLIIDTYIRVTIKSYIFFYYLEANNLKNNIYIMHIIADKHF